jgi:hypothetical protein
MKFIQLAIFCLLFSGYMMRNYLLSNPSGPKKSKLSSLAIVASYTKNDLKKNAELLYPLIAKPKMILDRANKKIDFFIGKNIKSQITFASKKRGSTTIDFEKTKKKFQVLGKDVIKYGDKFNFSLLLNSPKYKIHSIVYSFKTTGEGKFKFHLVLQKVHKAKTGDKKKVVDPKKKKLDKFDVIIKAKNPSQEHKDMVSWFKTTFPGVKMIQN